MTQAPNTHPLTIGVTGATGFIGRALVPHLVSLGHTVIPITRHPNPSLPHARLWHPMGGGPLPVSLFDGLNAFIHLAGPSINQRWSPAFKAHQLQARIGAVQALATTYPQLPKPPTTTLIVSGIGAYGASPQPPLTPAGEDAPYGSDFLATLAQAQDAAAAPLAAHTRLVIPRLGIVLGAGGGALQPLYWPHRLGLGGPMGQGSQIWSWLSRTDCVRALAHLLTNQALTGPVNLVSPNALPQAQFSRQLAGVWGLPAFMPTPAWLLRLMLGDMSTLLLHSTHATPEKLLQSDFSFAHPTLPAAIRHELSL
jgi:uncharacterized protein